MFSSTQVCWWVYDSRPALMRWPDGCYHLSEYVTRRLETFSAEVIAALAALTSKLVGMCRGAYRDITVASYASATVQWPTQSIMTFVLSTLRNSILFQVFHLSQFWIITKCEYFYLDNVGFNNRWRFAFREYLQQSWVSNGQVTLIDLYVLILRNCRWLWLSLQSTDTVNVLWFLAILIVSLLQFWI